MSDTKISQLTAATTPLDGTEVLPIVQSGGTKKVTNNDLRPKQIQSNATSGVLQVAGPANSTTRVMTVPDANFSAARTDAAQTFTGLQSFTGDLQTLLNDTVSTAKIGRTDRVYIELERNDFDGGFSVYTTTSGGGGIAKRLDVAHTGNVTVNTGNLVIGTSGKGIDFSATPGTGTSELLDDYEEGTWTPVVADAATGGNASSTVGSGTYTKVGRMVTVAGSIINISTTGLTAGDSVFVRGFPFSTTGIYVGSTDLRDIIFTDYPVTFMTGSSFRLFEHTTGGGITAITVSDLTAATSDIYFSLTYEEI
jgi:hypothetical protein